MGDHLRFGIICGAIWGSFPVWGSFAVGDHLWRWGGDLPQTHREKIAIEVCGEETKLLERPWIRSIVKRLRSLCSAADAVSGVLPEVPRQDIKIFLPLFIYRALHLRRVWVDITACKLTTTCVRHWSQNIYNFPIVSVQHCSTCFPRKLQTVWRRRNQLLAG